MSTLRFFGALSKICRTNIKYNHAVKNRFIATTSQAAQEREDTKPKLVDSVGVIDAASKKSTPLLEVCDFGTQKFADIIKLEAFVDKTLFIKAFFDARDKVIVTLAPRRFGKTTNMDMLQEFVSGNHELFEGLKIYKEQRDFFDNNCKQNPVIHVDFRPVGGNTADEVLRNMKSVIRHAYEEHEYLVKQVGGNYVWSNEKLKKIGFTAEEFVKHYREPQTLERDEVIRGFKQLSQCLHLYHGEPVYAFIDEYDAPIMKAIMKTHPEDTVLTETIDLISELMSDFLKGNDHVKKGLINACVRISEVLSSGANNIEYYEFLNNSVFDWYFGFTEEEVEALLQKSEFRKFNDNRVKQWYNGYESTESKIVIYSTYSILHYLRASSRAKESRFKSYWVGSGDITHLKELFAKVKIRRVIEKLINDEQVQIKTVSKMSKDHILTLKRLVNLQLGAPSIPQVHLFLQFLSDNGYLNVVEYNDDVWCTLKAPNEEIKKVLTRHVYNSELFIDKYKLTNTNTDTYVDGLMSLLQKSDRDAFIKFAKAVSELFKGAVIPNNEDELHSILFTLAYNYKEFVTRSELSVKVKQIRKGRPPHLDILVVGFKVGIIIELKFKNQSSEMAYEQIINQKYAEAFDDYKDLTKKILLGLHMNENREVSLTYSVDGSTITECVTSNDNVVKET